MRKLIDLGGMVVRIDDGVDGPVSRHAPSLAFLGVPHIAGPDVTALRDALIEAWPVEAKPLAPGSLIEVPTDPRKVMDMMVESVQLHEALGKCKTENARLTADLSSVTRAHADESSRLAALQTGVDRLAGDAEKFPCPNLCASLRALVSASRGGTEPVKPAECVHEPTGRPIDNQADFGYLSVCRKCSAKIKTRYANGGEWELCNSGDRR